MGVAPKSARGGEAGSYTAVIAESTDLGGNPVWTFTKIPIEKGLPMSLQSTEYLYSDVSSKKTIYDLFQFQHVNPYFNLYAKVNLICMYKTSKTGSFIRKSFSAGEQIVHRIDTGYFYCVARAK